MRNLPMLFGALDDLFESPWEKYSSPLLEHTDRYALRLEVPGYSQEDVKVHLSENVLKVSGHIEKSDDVFSSKGSFSKTVLIPDNIDHDAINAEIKNGILVITLPKKEKSPELREVSVKQLGN